MLFFKLGKFYEIFFDDAILVHRLFDLNIRGDVSKKLHCGFPEVNLDFYLRGLVDHGYKVAVIE